MLAIALTVTVTVALYHCIHILTGTDLLVVSSSYPPYPSYPSTPLRLYESRQQRVMGDGTTRWGTWLT
jgi:hypothetical protein